MISPKSLENTLPIGIELVYDEMVAAVTPAWLEGR
jgi:hypothetical protein